MLALSFMLYLLKNALGVMFSDYFQLRVAVEWCIWAPSLPDNYEVELWSEFFANFAWVSLSKMAGSRGMGSRQRSAAATITCSARNIICHIWLDNKVWSIQLSVCAVMINLTISNTKSNLFGWGRKEVGKSLGRKQLIDNN